MKKSAIVLVSLILFCLCLGTILADDVVVGSDTEPLIPEAGGCNAMALGLLNIRPDASTKQDPVAKFKKGTWLRVLAAEDTGAELWLLVEVPEVIGEAWVAASNTQDHCEGGPSYSIPNIYVYRMTSEVESGEYDLPEQCDASGFSFAAASREVEAPWVNFAAFYDGKFVGMVQTWTSSFLPIRDMLNMSAIADLYIFIDQTEGQKTVAIGNVTIGADQNNIYVTVTRLVDQLPHVEISVIEEIPCLISS